MSIESAEREKVIQSEMGLGDPNYVKKWYMIKAPSSEFPNGILDAYSLRPSPTWAWDTLLHDLKIVAPKATKESLEREGYKVVEVEVRIKENK